MITYPSPISLEAFVDIPAYRLVRVTSAGKVDLNAVGVSDFTGIAQAQVTAGSKVAVLDKKTPGVARCVAAKAIGAIGTVLYAAASGKVSDASSGTRIGLAFSTAAADGEQIDVLLD